jgi:hypothetical protein
MQAQRSCGIRPFRSRSTFSGSVWRDQPRRRARRPTCVSTTTPSGAPKAFPRTTFAVFRPTPGSALSSAIVRGTSPPCCVTIAFAAPRIERPLALKNPVDRISRSIAPAGAAASAAASGNRAKSAGVTWLTRSSVHWAERIVETRSSSGEACSSEHPASGYAAESREIASATGAAGSLPLLAFVGLFFGRAMGAEDTRMRSVRVWDPPRNAPAVLARRFGAGYEVPACGVDR